MAWSLLKFLGLTAQANAANLNQLRTNLNDHLRLHAHSGAAGDGASLSAWRLGNGRMLILPFRGNFVGLGWATTTNDASAYFGGYVETDNSNQNNRIEFQVCLRGGTWRLDAAGLTGSDYGISTVTLEGATIGTLDWYSATTPVYNVIQSIASFSVPALPIGNFQQLALTQATKNASSSAYRAKLIYIALQRTGS